MTDHREPEPAVALLGTGTIGLGMGRSLLRAGIPVRAWNRTRRKAEPLYADGALVVDRAADAVRGAGIIVTVLSDGAVTADVLAAARPGLSPGQLWVQASTVGIKWNDELAGLAREQGLTYLDAPVLGSRVPAGQGQLVVLAGGPDDADARARVRTAVQPVFDAIGRSTIWLDTVGAGTRLKLVASSWVAAVTAATGETLALARGLGTDPQAFLAAVRGGPLDCGYLQAKAGAILAGDYSPDFTTRLAAEATALIVAAGEDAGLNMDVTTAAGARFARATALGHGGDDMAAAFFASFGRVL
ncbi:MAG TPA: NAD(P)-dependent oxidoreductase [Streptosporangiaceae bacterium]|nr:NAD(P)-dependent oxidoreductase [Streptosporangiaceae bacterium]